MAQSLGGFPTPELVVPSSSYISTEKQTKLRNNELSCSSIRRLVDNEFKYILTVILSTYIYIYMYVNICLRILRLFYASKNPARQPLNERRPWEWPRYWTRHYSPLLWLSAGKSTHVPEWKFGGKLERCYRKTHKTSTKKSWHVQHAKERPVRVFHEGVTRFHYCFKLLCCMVLLGP